MSEEEECFLDAAALEKWLAEERKIPALVRSAAASVLFKAGYIFPSSLLNIQREDLNSLNLSPPHRNVLFNKLQQPQQQQGSKLRCSFHIQCADQTPIQFKFDSHNVILLFNRAYAFNPR